MNFVFLPRVHEKSLSLPSCQKECNVFVFDVFGIGFCERKVAHIFYSRPRFFVKSFLTDSRNVVDSFFVFCGLFCSCFLA